MIILIFSLSACQPVPDAKLTDLSTFDDKKQRDGLIHGNVAISPPTEEDNAKITIDGDNITLAKAHVMSVKSERYQPAFRLEGVIIPHRQTTITLPKNGKLDHMNVDVGSTIKAGDVVARFYQTADTLLSQQPKNKRDNVEVRENTLTQDSPTAHDANDTNEPLLASDTPVANSLFEVRSPMSGKVEAIFTTDKNEFYTKTTPILVVSDAQIIKFISPLPEEFADYLAVGDGVNFDTEDGRVFSGQIEKILPNPKVSGMMDIHVTIKPEQAKKARLKLGERVGGYVHYGQIEVGVLVPAFAIFDDNLNPMDLSELSKPPYKPATPKPAFLWTVGQNERLTLSDIAVIEYYPESDRYLIAGIRLDGLIVLADLPKHADGRRVRLH